MFVGCRDELLKPVEIPQVQFSDKVFIGSYATLGENIETSWVTFAWRLALSMFTVRVRGLLCRTASACGVSTGAVLGRGCLHARCVQTVLGSRRAENCDFSQLQSRQGG